MKRRKRSGSCQVLSRRLKSERQTLSCPLNTRTQTMRFRQAAIESSSKNGVTKTIRCPAGQKLCRQPSSMHGFRFRRLEAFAEHSVCSSAGFLRPAAERVSYAVACIPTDGGSEFTDRPNNSKANRSARFEKTLSEPGFLHKRLRPYRPAATAGGRSRRRDGEGFRASHGFCSFAGFSSRRALRRRRCYNFPHASSAPLFPVTGFESLRFFSLAYARYRRFAQIHRCFSARDVL